MTRRCAAGRRVLGLFSAFALLLSFATACNPAQTVGDILAELHQRVDSIISTASTEANATLINAATQVQLTVDSVSSNLSELLDQAYDRTNTTVQNTVNEAQAMVDDLDSKASAQLDDAVRKAQQISNSLPLTNKNPQVTVYTPAYLSNGGLIGDSVAFDVAGNFVHAFELKQKPLLLAADGTTFEAGVLTTQNLTFFLPAQMFRLEPGDQALRRVTLTLRAPYEKGRVFKTIKPGEFSLTVSLLPPSPVKSMVLHTVQVVTDKPSKPPLETSARLEPQPAENVFSWDCHDKNVLLGPFHPMAGWKIDTGTIRINKEYPKRNRKNSTVELEANTENEVSVRVRTKSNCGPLGAWSKDSGNVSVSVSFTEYRQPPTPDPVTTKTPTQETIEPLSWGSSATRGVTENEWELKVELWDGTKQSFTGTDVSNPYLKVHYEQGAKMVTVKAVSTGELASQPKV